MSTHIHNEQSEIEIELCLSIKSVYFIVYIRVLHSFIVPLKYYVYFIRHADYYLKNDSLYNS